MTCPFQQLAEALATKPVMPVIGPHFGQMLLGSEGELTTYKGVTKAKLGECPMLVVAASFRNAPSSPVAVFSLN